MKKYFFKSLVILYVLSYLLPYMKLISVETYHFQAHFGFEFVKKNWVMYLILVILFIIYYIMRGKNRIYNIFVGTAFTVVSVFTYSQVLHLDATNVVNSLNMMGKLLLPGYYISTLFGLLIGILLMNEALNLPDNKKKKLAH